MRRILLPFFVLTLAFGLVACDDAPAPDANAGDAKPAVDTPETGASGALGDAAAGAAGDAGTSSCCKDKAAEGACCKEEGAEGSCCKEKEAAAAAACVCMAGKAGMPVWCESCDKGFVDGKEVCCPSCVQKAVKKAAAAAGEQ